MTTRPTAKSELRQPNTRAWPRRENAAVVRLPWPGIRQRSTSALMARTTRRAPIMAAPRRIVFVLAAFMRRPFRARVGRGWPRPPSPWDRRGCWSPVGRLRLVPLGQVGVVEAEPAPLDLRGPVEPSGTLLVRRRRRWRRGRWWRRRWRRGWRGRLGGQDQRDQVGNRSGRHRFMWDLHV